MHVLWRCSPNLIYRIFINFQFRVLELESTLLSCQYHQTDMNITKHIKLRVPPNQLAWNMWPNFHEVFANVWIQYGVALPPSKRLTGA